MAHIEANGKRPHSEATWDDALDALNAAPDSHRVVTETAHLRAVEVHIPPGVKEPIHTHKWPSTMIIHQSAALRYYDASGVATDIPRRDVDADHPFIEELGPEGPHAVENIDIVPYTALRVEYKGQ